jgi:phosphate transport system substrate-binding protein
MRKTLGMLSLLLLAAALVGTLAPARSAVAQEWEPRQLTASLKGSGATFPNPLYQTWIQVYKNVVPGVSITYQGVGSGQGIRDFIGYLTDFGGTDAAISASRVETEAPDALHVPTVLGAVVPIYNVRGNPELRFSPETLAGIYLGSIRTWNHAAIAADNPGVRLPNQSIVVVHRSDGSGTTSIFTDYLSKVNAEWRENVGSGTSVDWPVGIGAPGNPGVASTVLQTAGSIGYVELIFALANGLSYGPVQNASGNYIEASIASVTAAAAGIEYPASLAVSITNPPGPRAYPIAGFTYLLVRQNTYTDANKASALTDFIYWGLTEGQGGAARLGYAPLPDDLRALAIGQLRKVEVNGEKVFDGPVK